MGVLADGHLEEEERQSDEKEHDGVGDQEGAAAILVTSDDSELNYENGIILHAVWEMSF